MSLSSLILKIDRKFLLAAVLLISGVFLTVSLFFILSGGSREIAERDTSFELRGVGRIPNLTYAMANNPELRNRVETFCAYDESYVFGQINAVDRDIVDILFLWSGIDLDEPVTQNTPEGIHPHIDHFIRAAYNMSNVMPLINNPLVGDDPWVRWFAKYKSRLIAQCTAGGQVYNGTVTYNVERDNIVINGELSADFINGFHAFIQSKDDKKLYTNNLLAFINDTKGLKNLSNEERALIEILRD